MCGVRNRSRSDSHTVTGAEATGQAKSEPLTPFSLRPAPGWGGEAQGSGTEQALAGGAEGGRWLSSGVSVNGWV